MNLANVKPIPHFVHFSDVLMLNVLERNNLLLLDHLSKST